MKSKMVILLLAIFINSSLVSANTNLEVTSKKFKYDLDNAAVAASVKTDLYFCLLGAIEGRVTNDEIIDQIILSKCDETLNKARELNVTDEEINQMAEKIKDEKEKKRRYILN